MERHAAGPWLAHYRSPAGLPRRKRARTVNGCNPARGEMRVWLPVAAGSRCPGTPANRDTTMRIRRLPVAIAARAALPRDRAGTPAVSRRIRRTRAIRCGADRLRARRRPRPALATAAHCRLRRHRPRSQASRPCCPGDAVRVTPSGSMPPVKPQAAQREASRHADDRRSSTNGVVDRCRRSVSSIGVVDRCRRSVSPIG